MEYGDISGNVTSDIAFSAVTQKFTVEGVPCYVASPEEIPDENMDKMKSQAEDTLRSTAVDWGENVQLDSVEYIGNYFLYKKPDFYTSCTNVLHPIDEIHATQFGKNSDGSQSEKPVDYYWHIGFHDGILLGDELFLSFTVITVCLPAFSGRCQTLFQLQPMTIHKKTITCRTSQ